MPTERNLLNHNAGKGDKERSSKWRENYSGIDWGVVELDGFVQRGLKQVKTYGSPKTYAWVNCIQHGEMPLTETQFCNQFYGLGFFLCPRCNARSHFHHHERAGAKTKCVNSDAGCGGFGV